jgi:hypothetical protein
MRNCLADPICAKRVVCSEAMADQNEAKQIDSVTDYVEDKEDTNLQSGLSSLVAASSLTRSHLLLFSQSDFFFSAPEIKISREDILLISEELEISKEEAEKLLKLNGGVVRNVFSSFVSAN